MHLPEAADQRGSIDAADLKRTLAYYGGGIITKLAQAESSTAELLDTYKSNIFAPMEADELVEYILLSMSTNIDIDEIKNKVGEPAAVFTGYNPEHTVCLLSGLSFPEARLDGIERQIAESVERRQRARERKPATAEKVVDLGLSIPKKPRAQMSREDLFAKYRKKQ